MIEKRWLFVVATGMFSQMAIIAQVLHHTPSAIYLAVIAVVYVGLFVRESYKLRRT
jgi:hypothetical protein